MFIFLRLMKRKKKMNLENKIYIVVLSAELGYSDIS